MTHRFTVVIPTRGQGRGLGRAVASVLAQEEPARLLVMVDGTPTDQSDASVLRTLQTPHRVIRSGHWGRPGPLRNMGLAAAETEYVGFLDDDDEYLPGKLSSQLSFLTTHRADLVASDAMRIVDGRVAGTFGHWEDRRLHLKELSSTNPIITSTVVGRTDVLRNAGGFPVEPAVRFCDDYVAWLRVARRGRIWIQGECQVRYESSQGRFSLSSQDNLSGAETVSLARRAAGLPDGALFKFSAMRWRLRGDA